MAPPIFLPRPAQKTTSLGPESGRPGPGTTREDARHRGDSGGETIVQIGLLWAEFRSKNGKRPEAVLLFQSSVATAKSVVFRVP